jgi:arylsulfatase A-like enzyme
MKKSIYLSLLALLIVFIGCDSTATDSESSSDSNSTNDNAKLKSRPNIILILTDDHGYADLNVQGSVADLKTPHLDQLAATGVRLTSGYVTAPTCMPSRAGLLSGKYQQCFGLDHNRTIPFPLEEKMISQRMKDAGYVTGMTGKWHLEPNHQQIEWIDEHMPESANRNANERADISFENKIPYLPTGKGFDYVIQGSMNNYWSNHSLEGEPIKPQTVEIPGYRLDIQTQAAVTFINKYKDDPFFFYLSYFGPHVPLEATEERLSRFPDDMPERRRMCLAMLAAIDDGVGEIKETLRKHNIEDNTLIIFLGDNGAPLKIHKEDVPLTTLRAWNGSLNDPFLGEKGMVAEGGSRVPFIMNWPNGLPKGIVYDRPIISLDIAATSLAIAGEEVPEELDGVNVVPFINGNKEGDPHEALYWRFWHQSAIRVGDWKYHKYLDEEFLFNVATEEHEHLNLIAEHPEKAKELKEKLTEWSLKLKKPGLELEDSREARDWLLYYFHESIEG